ncbi:hypothetical protein CHS0354_036204 [Potamilus streckersoni]|uniref:Anoctamin n=1 Tax=Potamilus streckersoni TaxID=2493646 RepID=A0AAE0SVI6_9BIVA|nr:hypothetical protein CHS0354_036204 [Potamilus streckersoni]
MENLEEKSRLREVRKNVGEGGSNDFKPLVVIEFDVTAQQPAIEWLLAKLQASQKNNGAELLVRPVVMQHNQETIFFISATMERLLLATEMMEIKKVYKDGYHREFTLQDVANFKNSEDLDNFLTVAEKQKIILHELEALRAGEEDGNIPGYEAIKLYPGKSLVKKYLSRQIIKNLIPLHDQEQLKRLRVEWYYSFKSTQPIDKIRDYFGEKIAMYFAFLGFYTIALIPPAVIGILYFITSWESVYREAIFAVFNLVWTTIFLEYWKRYCSELAYRWGTLDHVSSQLEEPRANFYGVMGENLVTRKPEPVYPKYKQVLRFYGVTVPIIALCLVVCFYIMLGYFILQDWADQCYAKEKGWLNFINLLMPTVIYAVVIGIVNTIYRKVAKQLNDWENHRLQSSYENHLTVKLILFNFVNCFISLFYVAFYMQNMTVLRSHLSTLLVTQQLVGQFRESLVPFFFHRRRAIKVDEAIKKVANVQKIEFFNGEVDEAVQKQASIESTMDVYEGTMDDYLEMFLQFGYVFLFSSVFPLAALWALINNVMEIPSDAFKMCRVFQRPFSEPAANIGVWQVAFEIIGAIAVMTNCALIGMNPDVQKLLPSNISAVNIVIIFVIIEHIILSIKAAVAFFIPDVPKWVEIEMARMAYQSRLALQKEQIERAEKERILRRQIYPNRV